MHIYLLYFYISFTIITWLTLISWRLRNEPDPDHFIKEFLNIIKYLLQALIYPLVLAEAIVIPFGDNIKEYFSLKLYIILNKIKFFGISIKKVLWHKKKVIKQTKLELETKAEHDLPF